MSAHADIIIMWLPEDNLQESFLSIYHVSQRDCVQFSVFILSVFTNEPSLKPLSIFYFWRIVCLGGHV